MSREEDKRNKVDFVEVVCYDRKGRESEKKNEV